MDERRDDWKRGVDENLAMLNSAQRTTDKQLENLDNAVEQLDLILRGDPTNDTLGISAQYDALETLVNELRSTTRRLTSTVHGSKDVLGRGKGHEQRLEALEGRSEYKAQGRTYFWQFVTATASGALVVVTLLILNWERVEDFAQKIWQHVHPVAAAAPAEKPRHRAHKKKKLPPLVVPDLDGLSKQQEPPP